ncbi:MAG: hypothetical protein K8R73_08650 [Clostridiales bacterium]|nr:hypothetical protein [Clostridiales bacterium]
MITLEEINIKSALLDLIFYPVGIKFFFDNTALSILATAAIIILIITRKCYRSDCYSSTFNAFIEFLNHMNTYLSVGYSFKNTIVKFDENDGSHPVHLCVTMKALQNVIAFNGTDQRLFEILLEQYPIKETESFQSLMHQALLAGSQSSYIVNVTLDLLYLKNKTQSEVELILFQKKLEQMILCLAPLAIIGFIKMTSSQYLSILYTTLPGRMIMLFAFTILILMKLTSDHIVKIKLEG